MDTTSSPLNYLRLVSLSRMAWVGGFANRLAFSLATAFSLFNSSWILVGRPLVRGGEDAVAGAVVTGVVGVFGPGSVGWLSMCEVDVSVSNVGVAVSDSSSLSAQLDVPLFCVSSSSKMYSLKNDEFLVI